jgi:predicted nucleic acid-binding protein
LILPDSSVVIAAFAAWHNDYAAAREALLDNEARLIAHVAFETVSVLSRMPESHRIAAPLVLKGLLESFPDPWLALDNAQIRPALERAVAAGLHGGALYDALIAATALRNDAQLISADRRARPTYEALGVEAVYLTS